MDREPSYRISFEGNLGKNSITPRGLNSLVTN